MNIQLWPLDRIRPYEHNPRKSDQAVDAVAASIHTFGFHQPIVVDADGVIVVGHTRWKAARALGLTEVPVHIAGELTPEQARAYRIADNQSATIATWDSDILPVELTALKDMGFDLDLPGFGDDLEQWLAPNPSSGEADTDDAPEPPAEPISQPGDIWTLGAHRILCGDSTVASDVDRLMAGGRAVWEPASTPSTRRSLEAMRGGTRRAATGHMPALRRPAAHAYGTQPEPATSGGARRVPSPATTRVTRGRRHG